MKLIRDIQSNALPDGGCVLTIGNFDAVHIGHQHIIERLRSQGDRLGLPVVVMTFDPHPEEYFRGIESSPRLTDCSTRFFALRDHGVDIMLLLRFNEQLAGTEAEAFINEYLVGKLKVRHLLVGDDFRFGKGRIGNIEMLRQAGKANNFSVENTATIKSGGLRVSSSRIRGMLDAGELDAAKELLGRPYKLVGRVSHGQQLGRQWGFPTLNLPINHRPALTGVFAVQVRGIDARPLPGVANLGKRPTVGGLKTLLEVHLFDFNREIYGQRVCVEFIEKIRDEQKFDSFDALKEQIGRDTEKARDIMKDRLALTHNQPIDQLVHQ